uniref:Uncharacterized protein n=1 Tax=Anguilla anguilla TaxID=7936 RepID=A0A0E9V746_ANGAN
MYQGSGYFDPCPCLTNTKINYTNFPLQFWRCKQDNKFSFTV